MAKKTGDDRPAEWNDPSGRVKWLVETHYRGNRSSFAAAVGVSHTAIANIVNGKKPPGRKLLTAIAQRLAVNLDWLLTGQDSPFIGSNSGPARGVPISLNLLPGKPSDCISLLAGRWLDDSNRFFTSTQYWLLLETDHGVFQDIRLGFRAGDKILIETDPEKFPDKDSLSEHLCVLNLPEKNKSNLVLGRVTYRPNSRDSTERLSAYLYGDRLVIQKLEHPNEYVGWEPDPEIRYADIVGVWMRLIRR